jgi:hypothetical protein
MVQEKQKPNPAMVGQNANRHEKLVGNFAF